MYERLLDKAITPTDDYIQEYLGMESYGNLIQFEKMLSNSYDLDRKLKFPFGNNYGWGYKYSHRLNHLCYAFFESGAFTVTLQLGDACVPTINKILPALSEKAIYYGKAVIRAVRRGAGFIIELRRALS